MRHRFRSPAVASSGCAAEAQPLTPVQVNFKVKDPVSAGTHFAGCLAAVFATPVILTHAAGRGAGLAAMTALSVFMLSMVLLYGASAAYHTFDIHPAANKRLKKLDHSMIFVLIAGSYTPVCLLALPAGIGRFLLALVWGIAAAGILLKNCWVTCPKWFSSVLYISMGWVCVLAMPQLVACLSARCFGWLLAGGIAYTVGGVIYALKLQAFNKLWPGFGSHEVFHLFVMLGSACHFVCMWNLPV